MKDQDAIDTLIEHHGSVAKAAAALGIIETRMANWRRRGINGRAGKPGRKASPKGKRKRNGRPQLKGKNGQKRRGKRRGVSTVDAKDRGRAGRRGESRQAA
jgi:hypothetical protein